jgi:Lsr2
VAQRTEIVFTDDLDGGPADGTVTFGLGSTAYEIDLSRKNADKFAEAIAPYLEAGRRVRSGGTRRSGAASPVARQDQSAVREWARGHGLKVSDRGRIPANVIAEYEAAH